MYSAFGKINLRDLAKGGVLVVLIVVLDFASNLLKQHGLDLTLDKFSPLLDMVAKALGAYVLQSLGSNEEGKFLGKIG